MIKLVYIDTNGKEHHEWYEDEQINFAIERASKITEIARFVLLIDGKEQTLFEYSRN